MFDPVLTSKKAPYFSHFIVRGSLLLVTPILLLSGCGGGGGSAPSSPTPPSGGGPSTPPAEEAQGLLIQIADQTELTERAKQGFESFLTNVYEKIWKKTNAWIAGNQHLYGKHSVSTIEQFHQQNYAIFYILDETLALKHVLQV